MELKPLQTIRTTERDYSKSKASVSRKNRYVSSMNSRNSYLRTIDEERVFAALNLEETDGVSVEELSSERQKLKDMKIKEFLLKGEKQRKSLYIRRESQRRRPKQNNKVRVHSPRTPSKVEVCKIKALEDLKKAKRKMKMAKEKTMEGRSTLEGFACGKMLIRPRAGLQRFDGGDDHGEKDQKARRARGTLG
ncbi:hypothetical protein L1049_009716 [Liquidambar formosana]|uniref:Uncharacterized protein n=1 Tax=Liquidambar formosana TaxID=63359 RepID=A0AAP0N759_LIQFO